LSQNRLLRGMSDKLALIYIWRNDGVQSLLIAISTR